MTCEPGLVPELSVTDYKASRHFWCDLVGFSLRYERPEEGFGYLVLGNAHLMLDQISLGRTWETGPLELPLGRGINFEVQVDNLDPALQRIISVGWPIFVEPKRSGIEQATLRSAFVSSWFRTLTATFYVFSRRLVSVLRGRVRSRPSKLSRVSIKSYSHARSCKPQSRPLPRGGIAWATLGRALLFMALFAGVDCLIRKACLNRIDT